jgi:hypothetical protein
MVFNTAEGWSRDVSEEIANDLQNVWSDPDELSTGIQEFIGATKEKPQQPSSPSELVYDTAIGPRVIARAIAIGLLWRHESGTYVKFTDSGAASYGDVVSRISSARVKRVYLARILPRLFLAAEVRKPWRPFLLIHANRKTEKTCD